MYNFVFKLHCVVVEYLKTSIKIKSKYLSDTILLILLYKINNYNLVCVFINNENSDVFSFQKSDDYYI